MITFNILEVLHSGKIILTDTICRMCLKPSSNMISIFSKIVIETECPISPKTSHTIRILELFEYFMQIQTCDKFSNMVCKMCIKNAQDVFIFKTKVKEIDSWLQLNVDKLKMINCSGKKSKAFSEVEKEQIYKISKAKTKNNSSKEDTSIKPVKPSFDFQNSLLQTNKDVETINKNTKTSKIPNAIDKLTNISDNLTLTETITIVDENYKRIDQRNLEAVKKALPQHIKEHDYDLIFCDLCDQYFPDQYSYKQHDKVHTIKHQKCNICNVYFSRKGGFVQHMKGHARKAALHQMPVNYNDAFFPFMMNSDGEKSITCALCGEIFTQFRAVEKHMRSEHVPGFMFGCHFCGEGFNDRLNLMQHLKSHISFNPYSCAHCPETFKKMADITNHVKIHAVDPLLITQQNQGEYNPPKIEVKLFLCSFCGKNYSDQVSLRYHFRTHTGEKAFLCQLCGKTFVSKAQLNTHLRTHEAKKFKCTTCGKTYAQPETLKYHMKSHTSDVVKYYDCNLCEKRFKTHRSLRLHVKYHNNEDLHQCTICGKAFVNKCRLKQHFTVHTDERPFTCKYCDKAFRTRFSLTSHVNVHEGIKPYVCNICDMCFARPDGLRKHNRRKHFLVKKCSEV